MSLGLPEAPGHSDLVSCLCLIPSINGVEPYVASGDCRGEVKLWNAANGEFVITLVHSQFVSDMMVFQDAAAGQPMLIVGLKNAGFVLRSCATMSMLFAINPTAVGLTSSVQTLANLGMQCFASAGDDGVVAVWRVLDVVEPLPQQEQQQQRIGY
jgi:hypothetical protein